ncbi:hypothetical protein CsatB_000293 [Cannabis sativa]
MWDLKVPPKTKDLVWRAASNCLATKANLCIKKVLVDNTCPMCGVYAETEMHLLVSCPFAWACWEFSGLSTVGRESPSLLQWLEVSANRVDKEVLGKIVVLCWAIWSARNDLIWQQRVRSVRDVVVFANSSLNQFLKAQGRENIPSLSPLKAGDGSEHWIKSVSGIKLNVDAATFDRDSKHGYGCVVRNLNGDLISVFAGCNNGKVPAELAEIMGIKEALSWLKCNNYTQAVIESDSLVCVEAIRSDELIAFGFGFIVDECKNMFKSLSNVALFFVKRSANCAAYFVARHSISLAERMFPINSVLMDFMSILMSDCSS